MNPEKGIIPVKPVTFHIQSDSINKLADRFGCYLEQLDRAQKIQIRVLLTTFLLGKEMMSDEYSIGDAWEDACLHLITADDDVIEVADILVDLTIWEAEGLLQALQEQCTVGNARLKTPVEITTDQLTQHGVPSELALVSAVIIREVDAVRERTAEEQEVINQIFEIMTKKAA
ncbi:hypothetical protein HW132_28280 [Brasilonema sp. CT11]|nr:hypothetical protein [Brasilonema sp. CT11]